MNHFLTLVSHKDPFVYSLSYYRVGTNCGFYSPRKECLDSADREIAWPENTKCWVCSAVHHMPPKCAHCLALYCSLLICAGSSRVKDGVRFIADELNILLVFKKQEFYSSFHILIFVRRGTKISIFLNLCVCSSKWTFSNRRGMRLRSFSIVLEFVCLSHRSAADLSITGLWLDQDSA